MKVTLRCSRSRADRDKVGAAGRSAGSPVLCFAAGEGGTTVVSEDQDDVRPGTAGVVVRTGSRPGSAVDDAGRGSAGRSGDNGTNPRGWRLEEREGVEEGGGAGSMTSRGGGGLRVVVVEGETPSGPSEVDRPAWVEVGGGAAAAAEATRRRTRPDRT